MSAKHYRYFEDQAALKNDQLTCAKCGWQGTFEEGDLEVGSNFTSCMCPKCTDFGGHILAMVEHPTIEDAERHRELLSEVDRELLDYQREHRDRVDRMSLKDASELPDLPGDELRLLWDYERDGTDPLDPRWTVIRCGDRVVWKEPAIYEGHERFARVGAICRERYGARLVDLVPTDASECFLYGDDLSSPRKVEAVRRQLNGDASV